MKFFLHTNVAKQAALLPRRHSLLETKIPISAAGFWPPATIATPYRCGSSTRYGGKYNNQLATVAMDSATATQRHRQWTAPRQCDGNATAAAAARQRRAAQRRHQQREGGGSSAAPAVAAPAAAQLRRAAGWQGHSATIATPSHCGSSTRWGKRQTINQQRWLWTAQRQRDSNGNGRRHGNATAMRRPQQRRGNGGQHDSGIGRARVAAAARRRPWRRRLQHSCGGQQGGRAAAVVAAQEQQRQRGKGGGSAVAAAAAARRRRRQQGSSSGGSVAVAARALQQPGGSAASLAGAPRREVQAAQRWWRRQCIDCGGQCVDSAMEVDIATAAALTAVLPPVEVKISTLC
jgi:hypothetical protein